MAPGITIRVVRIRGKVGASRASDLARGLRALTTAPVWTGRRACRGGTDRCNRFASTSSAYAIGFDDEVAMLARLSTHGDSGRRDLLCGRCGCSTLGG